MNNSSIVSNRESREINLIDLFWYIFSKWKTLLVWAIIGMVLVGGYKTYSEVRNTSVVGTSTTAVAHEENYDKLNILVDNAGMGQVNKLLNLVDRVYEKKAYMSLSEKAQIDATHINTIILQYNIDNGFMTNYAGDTAKDYTDRLNDAYINLASNSDMLFKCAEALGIDESYVGELISFEAGSTADIFNVRVIATTAERANLLADAIDECVQGATRAFSSEIGEHKLINVSRDNITVVDYSIVDGNNVGKNVNQSLGSWQVAQYDNIYAWQELVNTTLPNCTIGQVLTFEKMLYDKYPDGVDGINTRPFFVTEINPVTGERKSVIADYDATEKYIADNELGFTVVSKEVEEDGTEIEVVQPSISKTTILKFSLIGFVVGLLLAAAWYACAYIFGKWVKNNAELAGYGLNILGDMSHAKENNQTAVEKLRYKKAMPFAEARDLAFVNTRVTLQRNEGKQLVVSTMKLQGDVLTLAKELIADLKSNGIDVELADSINLNGASIEKLASAQSVVFIEQLGTLRYDQIEAALTKCLRQSVDISGVILF